MSEAEAPSAPVLAHRAITAPSSVDRTNRTVEVVWSTGARVRNWVHPFGEIVEELDMSLNAVRMGVLHSGRAPVLNNHRQQDARDVLGRVTSARIERGRGYATLQFSAAADVEPVWQRISDGTLGAVSVGYRVHRYDQITDPATMETVYRAVDWEPVEISVVAIPADRDAAIRAEVQQGAPGLAVEPALNVEENTMPQTTLASQADSAATLAPSADTKEDIMTDMNAARAAPDIETVRAEAARAERERLIAIDGAAKIARNLLPEERVAAIRDEAVVRGWSEDQARRAFFDALKDVSPIRASVVASNDDPASILDAMAEAIAARAMPGYHPKGDGRHVEYMGWRPSDMLRELMIRNGERNPPRNPAELATRAFHTTSDFPLLLSAAANKMLLAAYQPARPTYRDIFLRRDFRDFKPHRHLRIGDFPNLAALGEGGEIQVGTISETQETVTLATYARRVRVTRQVLVNDDLGAFTDFAAMIGRRVADFENATAYALLNTSNGDGPTLSDGTRVFSTAAARQNKASTGTALDLASLAAARAAVMKQKTLDGLPISVGSSMRLLVGPNQELIARQLTATITPSQVAQANVFSGFIQPVVDPQITGNRWYVFAEPPVTPVYVYGYLNGVEGPQVTTGPVQGADGVEISVVFDFGVGAVDWRGAYFNPGN